MPPKKENMSEASDNELIWVDCATCGHHARRHRVLFEKEVDIFDDPEGHPIETVYHRLAE